MICHISYKYTICLIWLCILKGEKNVKSNSKIKDKSNIIQKRFKTSDEINYEELNEFLGVKEYGIDIDTLHKAASKKYRYEAKKKLDVEEKKNDKIDKRNKLNNLPGRVWMKETKTVWRQRGLGKNNPHAQYERLHPAPFSYQDVGRLIRFFTKEDEKVLDPFLGIGSTLKASALLNRKGVGVELSPKWSSLADERLKIEVGKTPNQRIINMDIRDAIKNFKEEEFDFVITSPPYWKILRKSPDHKTQKERVSNGYERYYSNDDRDLGNEDNYEDFLDELTNIFKNVSKKISNHRYLAVIVSDFRHKSKYYPFHSDLYNKLTNDNLKLAGNIILEQPQKSLYPYGYPFCYVPNIHHQYIVLFKVER